MDGYCEKEIYNRIAIGKNIHGQEKTVHRQMKLGIEETNDKVSKVWSLALYAAETWMTMDDAHTCCHPGTIISSGAAKILCMVSREGTAPADIFLNSDVEGLKLCILVHL